MAASIQRTLDLDSELVEGSNGVFDVAVDGQIVFSKHETGRFPDDDEVIQILRARQSGD